MQDYLSIVMVKKIYLVHIYDNEAFIMKLWVVDYLICRRQMYPNP
jgi:hypothetical protein